MANINEEARIPVYINDEQAKSALKNLQGEAEKWRKKMFEAMESGNMKGMKDAERELKNVNKQVSQIKREAFDVNKVLQKISSASLEDINKAMRDLEARMKPLNRDTKEYQDLWKQHALLKAEKSKINAPLVEQVGILGKLKSLLPVIGWGAAIAGAKQLWSNITEVRKEFEKYEAVLTNSLGSQRAARKELNMLSDFAAQTPYQLSELTGAYVKLLNYGLKPTREDLTKMGDLASSVGKGFDQLTEAMADAVTGEFERLKEFGIKAKKEGDKITFTFKEQSTVVDANATSIKKYITGLGDLQGVSGSMAAISKTMGGATSNMADSFDRLFNKWGSGALGQYFVTQIRNITGFIDNLAGKTPTLVEELSSVREELNKEMLILETGNFTADQRATMIRKINTEYKDYLPNLLDEKSSLDQIQKFHQMINNQLQARIIYAGYEEEIKDLLKQQSQALAGNFEIEKKRTQLRLGLDESMKDRNPNDLNNLLDKATMINNGIIQNTDQKTKEVKDKYEFMAKSIGMTFSEIQKIVESTNKPNSTNTPKSTPDQKAASDALDTAHASEILRIKQYYADKEQLDKESKARLLAAELAYLKAKAQLESDNGKKIELQSQIIDKQKEYNQAIKEAVPELMKTYDAVSKSNSKLFEQEKLLKKASKAGKDAARETEELKKKQEEMANTITGSINVLSDGIYEMASGTEDAFKTFAKNLLNFALEQLKYQAELAIAGVTIQGLASLNPAEMLVAAGKIAVIEATFAAIEGLINGAFSTKSSSKGYRSGGPTGGTDKNKIAGFVHEDEWVMPSEGYNNPGIRPIVDLFEMARRNGSLARLDLRPVMMSVQSGRSFSSGGPTSQSSSGSTPFIVTGSAQYSSLSPEDIRRFADAVSRFSDKELILSMETFDRKYQNYKNLKNGGLKLNE